MNDRPFILKGIVKTISRQSVIGKVIKNDNVEENKSEYIQVLDVNNYSKFENGYLAYIFENNPESTINLENLNFAYKLKGFDTIINFDVLKLVNNEFVKVLYRDDSEDNVILTTNQCTSNCIMCPDSDIVRNTRENVNIDELVKLINCMPSDTKYITITGGEPTMLGEGLITTLQECQRKLPDTNFLLLTNGRTFSNIEFCSKFLNVLPKKIRIAIPIYADNELEHDKITRAEGSFKQTIIGIKRLIKENVNVEIRIVVMKANYKKLKDIAKFICDELSNVEIVNIMALEMLGNAFKNKDDVWIDFSETKKYIYDAVITLIQNGIMTNLYNFPLCNVDKRLYSLCKKSISDYKVRYKEECDGCILKNDCGGFFNSTINVKSIKVKPIKNEETNV